RMNPNMNYSSIQWGVEESTGGSGIVGALDFIDIIEATSLIYKSSHWTPDQHYKLKEWFFEFYQWLYHEYPVHAYSKSNVSTWLDVQRTTYLLFTEQEDKLNSSSHIEPVSKRMEAQFEANGTLPHEATREIAQHYVYFNLNAYMYLSLLRKNHHIKTGDDRDWPVLKNCGTNNCTYGLKAALDNITALIQGVEKSTLFNLDSDFNSCRYLEIFRPAAVAFDSGEFEQIANYLIETEDCRNSNILLTFPSQKDL
ncbi:MAG: alginate lyase family protein, partial [Balneolaceae bacterium]|nr:alginate lyase family protein [Balneolaceae bacterium]